MKSALLFRNTLVALLSCFILVVLCYWFVDQPVALWAAKENFRAYAGIKFLAGMPNYITAIVIMIYCYLAITFCYRPLNITEQKLCILANSIVIAEFIKTVLKTLFGRAWPATWTCHNPSLINDNVYGFYWVKAGNLFQSFPSGHATMILATMTVLWIFYPRWRVLWVLIATVVLISQALLYYHFVGDLVAGSFLGALVAIYTVKLSENMIMISYHLK